MQERLLDIHNFLLNNAALLTSPVITLAARKTSNCIPIERRKEGGKRKMERQTDSQSVSQTDN